MRSVVGVINPMSVIRPLNRTSSNPRLRSADPGVEPSSESVGGRVILGVAVALRTSPVGVGFGVGVTTGVGVGVGVTRGVGVGVGVTRGVGVGVGVGDCISIASHCCARAVNI